MPRLMSCSKAMRVLMMPSGGRPASVTPRCSGTSGRCFGEAAIDFDHLARVGIFERHAVAREAELDRAARNAPSALSSIGESESSSDRTLPAWPDRRSRSSRRCASRSRCRAGDVDQELDFVLPRLFALVVIEMARVVAKLVDVRGDVARPGDSSLAGRPTGWPCVCWRISARASASLLLSTAMRTTSAPASTRSFDLGDRGVDVLRVRGRHALHGDRMAGADRDRADADGAGWIARDVQRGPPKIAVKTRPASSKRRPGRSSAKRITTGHHGRVGFTFRVRGVSHCADVT